MLKNIKIFFAAGACAALLTGVSASAETVWKPPAEIAQKPAAEPGAASAPSASPPAAAPVSQADKEKGCKEQAVAKGLKGKAKRQFQAECLKS